MAMRAPVWLRRFPVVAGMALLLLPWVLARLPQHVLFGVQPPVSRPALSAAGLWSGAFQRSYTEYFDQTVPLLATAVGVKNQVYFSLLNQSGIPGVRIGKRLQLYEQAYIDEYCSRDTAAITAAADDWAADLARMQRWYAAQGKVFVYVVTPSKAATYPQYLPDARACRAPPADRDSMLPTWDAILDRHGIRHVDAASLVRQSKGAFPFEMFPRGGTHWNTVSAALAAQSVVRAINAAPMPWKLQDFTFTWTMAEPDAVARDLTDLLNLPFPRLDYRAPEVTVTPQGSTSACKPLDIAAVGGSFTYEIIWTIMMLPCAPVIDFYDYFQVTHAHFPGDIRGPVDPAARDDRLLVQAKIILLEENEQLAMRSAHGPAFYKLVAAQHPAAGAAGQE